MRFLEKFSCTQFQTKATKLFAFYYHPKTQLHTYLKPPKANQILKRHLNSNCPTKALSLFRELLRKSLPTIDSYSLLFVLKACTQKSSSVEGKQLHALVIKLGFEHVIHLQTSLVNMYSTTCNIVDARKLFDEMPDKNVVCWTTLISAYVDNRKPNTALQLFRQMQMNNVQPDQITVTVALSACADLGALDVGEWIHASIRREKGLNVDLCLKNALINMYAKCGDIEVARRLFDSLRRKDVTTWTSMIVGHALHGQAEEALNLFAKMKETRESPKKKKKKNDGCNGGASSIVPNDVTFIGVLMSCSHAGMVEEGKRQFRSMVEDYGLKPKDSHYGCMVDLFCRAGMLEEAYDFISKMPVRANAVVWRTLLGACSLNGSVELGSKVRQKLLELEPAHVGDSVVLSNIYAAEGMWERKMTVRDQMTKQRRSPGCSSIEVGSGISEFVASDDNHP
ncbi:hypothetical protein L484_008591 [Morus notabilis]|uniref:Pentatricopeptide repeat-containing protein n=2 Tax=Morus notabilis TaxID=981085 RepID=W9QJC6_9ROSA|nr:hypothetical protein L484_008591 [Morus notabilis]